MPFVTYQNGIDQSLRLLHIDNMIENTNLILTIDEMQKFV